jgi:hypothetical protein
MRKTDVPAAYGSCLLSQIKFLSRSAGIPDLSGFDSTDLTIDVLTCWCFLVNHISVHLNQYAGAFVNEEEVGFDSTVLVSAADKVGSDAHERSAVSPVQRRRGVPVQRQSGTARCIGLRGATSSRKTRISHLARGTGVHHHCPRPAPVGFCFSYRPPQ